MAQAEQTKTSSSTSLTPTTSAPESGGTAHKSHAHPNYILIWFMPWHKNIIVALLIGMAVWKAALVGLYYMHLRFETRRIVILALGPLPFCVILVAAVATEFFW